jgi:hypothetical protein
MDRPKLYLVSRNDGARPNPVHAEAAKPSQGLRKWPNGALRKTPPVSSEQPQARFLSARKPIWDDESSWDSI